MLTHLQKIQPLTYIFELGGSYEELTRRFSGTYVRIGADEQGLTINPFSLPFSPENLQFQWSLVRVLAESGGYALTGPDERELFEQIQNLYAIEPGQRRLLTLANILPRNLRQALGKWVLAASTELSLTMSKITSPLPAFRRLISREWRKSLMS